MPRRREVPKREILPDPKFGNVEVAKFMNVLMLDGKKSVAERIVYGAFDHIEKKANKEPLEIFSTAMGNVKPMVEVKSRRVGGATFQIPIEVAPERKIAVGMKWLISYSRKRNEKYMAENLAAEIIAASKGEGASVKKRDDTHKMAEANKAFSHFRA